MKSKRLYLNNETNNKKLIILYTLAIATATYFSIQILYNLYLHNPSFHIFIQNKGIFL